MKARRIIRRALKDAPTSPQRGTPLEVPKVQLESTAPSRIVTRIPEAAKPSTEKEPEKKESFGQAFARNRKAGAKTFSWNGKSYTTELKKSEPVKPSSPSSPPKEDKSKYVRKDVPYNRPSGESIARKISNNTPAVLRKPAGKNYGEPKPPNKRR